MKSFLITCFLFASLTAFAQSEKDTTVVKTDYVKIEGTTYNVKQLDQALHSSLVIATDEYWYSLYQLIINSKVEGLSVAQVNQLITPFAGYVQRYEQEQTKKQKK